MTGFEKWARREIVLALDTNDEDYEYMSGCYESALKAFKALLGDGHSVCSISITKAILNRLIDHKPLSPILGTDDEWGPVAFERHEDGCKVYRNNRYSSLSKRVYSNGDVEYSDNNYCVFADVDSESGAPVHHNGYLSHIIYDLYPITMPYYPEKPIIGYTKYCLFDTKNGDYDTIALYYILKDGERIEINRFFKENTHGELSPFTEISKEEFEYRLSVYNKRMKENKNE